MNWAAVLSIGAGLLLLIAGRKFFWLAAGLAAFVLGLSFFEAVFKDAGWIGIMLSAIGGIIFGWLAVKFIRIAGYIIGALAGAAALPFLLGLFGVAWSWLADGTDRCSPRIPACAFLLRLGVDHHDRLDRRERGCFQRESIHKLWGDSFLSRILHTFNRRNTLTTAYDAKVVISKRYSIIMTA